MEQDFRKILSTIGLIRIKLRIASKYYYFLVDSGSSANVISAEAAKQLSKRLEYVSDNEIIGVGGQKERNEVALLSFRFNHRDYTQEFAVMDAMPAFDILEAENGIHLDGILGTPFLYETGAIIDYANLKVRWGEERKTREIRRGHWYIRIVRGYK